MHSLAMIDKLAGDEVSGYYVPGIAGEEYAQLSVKAAQDLLKVTGHADPEGPWAPVGVGIHTGVAYFGAVGSRDDMVELTALGDAVNIAARLGSEAGAGEVVISNETAQKAGVDTSVLEKRTVELKGKSEPMDVWVMKVSAE
jgi:adenylate cyclase